MSRDLFTDLAWLPPAPADFKERCRLATLDTQAGKRLRGLASWRLDVLQLTRLQRVVAGLRAQGQSLAPLTPFRLGILGNGTLDVIVPAIVATAARHGLALECVQGRYDQPLQDAASPDSPINSTSCDAVLIAVDYRGLPLRTTPANSDIAASSIEAALAYLGGIREGIRKHSRATCIYATIPPPPELLFGSLDRCQPGTMRFAIDRINREIVARCADAEDLVLDVAAIAEIVGLAEWFDPTEWNTARLPFATRFIPLYAEHVARQIAALRGKSRRCLILDLDNTIWGGVIGDDGVEGIRVAQGDPVGEAFLSVQRWALSLRERGIILAVCSKNDDAVARAPFRMHQEMLLRENHIAIFQANWTNKAANIRAIAEELSLGLEAMVLLDDNPAERALVREQIPEVAVPELPDDPALYARTLSAAGYFEAVAFSEEDRRRADLYRHSARRAAMRRQAEDIDAYLALLEMRILFQPFDAISRPRIAQLINKSNQFNLTTRRYTEADVARVEQDPDYFTLQVRLTDIFGDNGMISVIICRARPDAAWAIDTWLMSCRVLSRGVERMVLKEILHHARARGVRRLFGDYHPTDRNKMVEHHYRDLGFRPVSAQADGGTTWELSTDCEIADTTMAVSRIGFEFAST
jgi:FkbH-like protein